MSRKSAPNPKNFDPKHKTASQKLVGFIKSPVFAFGGGVILTLIGTKSALVAAWACFSFAFYEQAFFEKWSNRNQKIGDASASVLIAVVLIVAWFTWLKPAPTGNDKPHPSPVYGELLPDTIRTPPQCLEIMNGPRSGVTLILGTKGFFTQKTMIPILIKGEQLFSISRSPTGGINITARIISFDNKLIAQIEGNKWATNPPESFSLDQPDLHTLTVRDSDNRTLLFLHYLNADAIQIEGRFYTTTGVLVVADSTGLHAGGVVWDGGCDADSPAGIVLG